MTEKYLKVLSNFLTYYLIFALCSNWCRWCTLHTNVTDAYFFYTLNEQIQYLVSQQINFSHQNQCIKLGQQYLTFGQQCTASSITSIVTIFLWSI